MRHQRFMGERWPVITVRVHACREGLPHDPDAAGEPGDVAPVILRRGLEALIFRRSASGAFFWAWLTKRSCGQWAQAALANIDMIKF
jgi:hypothetical protein